MEKEKMKKNLSKEDINVYLEDVGWKFLNLDYEVKCNPRSKEGLLKTADKIKFVDKVIEKYNKKIPHRLVATFRNDEGDLNFYIRANRDKIENIKDLEMICHAFAELENVEKPKFSIPKIRTAKHYIETRYPEMLKEFGDLKSYENMVFPLTTQDWNNFEIPHGGLLYGFFREPSNRFDISAGRLFESDKILSFEEFENLVKKYESEAYEITKLGSYLYPSLFDFARELEAKRFWTHIENLGVKKVPPSLEKSSKDGKLMYSYKTKNYVLCATHRD